MNPFSKFQRNNIRSQTLTNGGYTPFVFSSDGKVITANTVNADNALKNSDIFAVINRIASDISACTFRVNEPFKQLLDNPNNLINSYNFWQSVVSQLCLAGNCYVVIYRDNNGVPKRLEQIPIDQVTITLEDSSKDITYTVNYNDERGTKDIKSDNMLHFRLFVSGQVSTKYVGVSPLDSLVRELNLQDYSNKMSISMLKNAIAPSYTLTVPEGILGPDAKDKIRTEFEKANAGDNSGRAIVLDQGLQINPLQIDPDVAKLLSNVTFSQTQIAKAFGISDSYLNGQGDEQSSVSMMRSLFIDSLNPYMKAIESELTMKFGQSVNLDIESAVDIDNSDLIDKLVSLAGKSAVLSGTQIRQILSDKEVYDPTILASNPPVESPGGGENNENNGN